MRETGFVNISGIQYDELPMNPEVLDLVFFISSGGEIPPVKLQKTKTGWKLKDGRHRLAAYKLLGKEKIFAKYSIYEKRTINTTASVFL